MAKRLRWGRSAEDVAISKLPIDRTDITKVLHQDNTFTLVELRNGKLRSLTNATFKKLLGR